MMNRPIRTGIIDDHPGVRREILNLLSKEHNIVIVGEGGSGLEAIELVKIQKPELLLLDVELPVITGDIVVRQLRLIQPAVKVLAVSGYDDSLHILSMLENGADGYITKDEVPHRIIPAIQSIIQDQIQWISPRVALHIPRIVMGGNSITGRERFVLQAIALGEPAEGAARQLELGTTSIQGIIDRLMIQFGVSTLGQLNKTARRVLSTTRS